MRDSKIRPCLKGLCFQDHVVQTLATLAVGLFPAPQKGTVVDKEGWSMAGEFAAGLPAWSPQGHKASGQQGPSSWVMELAEVNQNPGAIPLLLGTRLGFSMICVLLPRAALARAHTTAHHSILTGNSSLAFATREGDGAGWGVQLANSPALCLHPACWDSSAL